MVVVASWWWWTDRDVVKNETEVGRVMVMVRKHNGNGNVQEVEGVRRKGTVEVEELAGVDGSGRGVGDLLLK